MNVKPNAIYVASIAAVLAVMGALLAYPALMSFAATAGTTTATSTTQSNAQSTYNATSSNGRWSGWPNGGNQTPSPPPNWGPGPNGGGGFGGPRNGGGPGFNQRGQQPEANFTVGQTISITGTQGEYHLASNQSQTGTASGSLTLTVSGKLTGGYTLSISSGTIVVGGTTYTISSGSAQMGPAGNQLSGQGTTTPSGNFLIRGGARGTFAGTNAIVNLDFSNGTTEYLITISGTVSN